jgi:hypothetical protein
MVNFEEVISAIERGEFSEEQLQRAIAAVVTHLTSTTADERKCSGESACPCGCADVTPMSGFEADEDIDGMATMIIKRIDNEAPFEVHFSEDEKVNTIHVDAVAVKNNMVNFSLNEVTYMIPTYQSISESNGQKSPVVHLDAVYNGKVHTSVPFKIVSTGTRKVEIGNLQSGV